MLDSESIYILWRKVKAGFNSLLFYFCWVFPIKKNLISVCTFEGKGGFGCNPKPLVQELHKRNPDYEFVWFVSDMGTKNSAECTIYHIRIQTPKVLNHCFDTTNCSVAFSNSRNSTTLAIR